MTRKGRARASIFARGGAGRTTIKKCLEARNSLGDVINFPSEGDMLVLNEEVGNGEIVDFIQEQTGLSEEIIIKVLCAQIAYIINKM